MRPEGSTPIPGWEGFYAITPDGEVWSERRIVDGRRRGGRWMRGSLDAYGYRCVMLCRSGVRRNAKVHRLVALVYIGAPPFDGAQVCHGDGDKQNNHVSNLRYDTCAGNAEDRRRHGTLLRGDTCPASRLTAAQVIEMRALRRAGRTYEALGRDYGVSIATAWRAVNGETWAHI